MNGSLDDRDWQSGNWTEVGNISAQRATSDAGHARAWEQQKPLHSKFDERNEKDTGQTRTAGDCGHGQKTKSNSCTDG